MEYFKEHIIWVACVVVGAFAITGCQSMLTTSAKVHNQTGDFEGAIELAQKALADNPEDAEAYFQLGYSYSKLDSVSLAYDCFIKSVELDPKKKKDAQDNINHNFVKHLKRGQSAYKSDDFQTASEEFELATQADPTQSTGYYYLGVSYYYLGRDVDPEYYGGAVRELDKVLELSNPGDSNYIKALELAGKALAATGREDDARERFERLIEEDPTSYQVIEDIGNDLLTAQQWRGAAVFLEMAAEARAKIGAEDFTLYYNVGLAHYSMRDEDPEAIDKAIMYYEKALDIQPDEPQTIFNIVVAYIAKQDYSGAIVWAEKYANINPTDSRAWQLLARCYSEVGEKDKAREALKRFETLNEQGGQ